MFNKRISLRDSATNQAGWELSVGAITWISKSKVYVQGGMYCGGLCADGGSYRVDKKQGRWAVTKYRMDWVS